MRRNLVLLSVLSTFAATLAWPCLHPPKDWQGKLGQSAQRAVLVFDRGMELLVLGVHYRVDAPGAAKHDAAPAAPRSDEATVPAKVTPPAAAEDAKTTPPAADKEAGSDVGSAPPASAPPASATPASAAADASRAAAVAPPQIGWVVTVPSAPVAYTTVENEVFDQTEQLFVELGRTVARSLQAVGPDEDLLVGPRVQVGPYDITPLTVTNPKKGAAQLDEWMKKNGFTNVEVKNTQYFAERRFTFLAIRVRPDKAAAALDPGGALPALAIQFKTEKPYYPLLFSSQQGVFDLDLKLISSQPLQDNLELRGRLQDVAHPGVVQTSLGIPNALVPHEKLPEALRFHLEQGKHAWPKQCWYLNEVQGHELNQPGTSGEIATWKDDVHFELAASAQSVQDCAPGE